MIEIEKNVISTQTWLMLESERSIFKSRSIDVKTKKS